MIHRPCADFLTRPSACLPACLPACPACPTCLTVLPARAYLSVPACRATCLCLPSIAVIRGRGRPDQRLCLIRLRSIVLIRIVLYGRSLAVRLNGGRLGCLPRRPRFDLIQ